MKISEHILIWKRFVIPRLPRLVFLIRHRGLSDGWFIWKIENNLILDNSGDFLDQMRQILRQHATRARWQDNEKEADDSLEFLKQLEIFRAIHHEK